MFLMFGLLCCFPLEIRNFPFLGGKRDVLRGGPLQVDYLGTPYSVPGSCEPLDV